MSRMARLPRIVVPDFPHHVTQRGNYRADVFDDDAARQFYLTVVRTYAAKHGVSIWSYCLMTNHVHFVVVPKAANSLALCFRGAHMRFSQWVNWRRKKAGHLWQNRYFSCVLDDEHLWAAVRYVERNPVRAGLVAKAQEWPWSSAPAHCGIKQDSILAGDFPPPGVVSNWDEWLSVEDAEISDVLRRHTHTGRPCGTPAFVTHLEEILSRFLRPKKRGRKRRIKKDETRSLF